MTMRNAGTRKAESGFALVLAILSLMLLTFLGLTLATTTTSRRRRLHERTSGPCPPNRSS